MENPRQVGNGGTLRLWLLGGAWVLPLWLTRFPPMIDYPQQLALAAIIRWYGDPARRFGETYVLVWTTPHALFKVLAAGLAWVIPIHGAGKLLVALSLAGVAPAAMALCRRAGRPGWYALAALAVTYNATFFWGFVDTLLAYPLILAGIALADRRLAGPWSTRSWCELAAVTLLFYTVHLQFLLLFAGAAGWLVLCRWPGWRRAALQLSALLPGAALGLGVLAHASLFAPAGLISAYERRMRRVPTFHLPPLAKLGRLPQLLFGPYSDGSHWLLAALLLAFVLAIVWRRRGAVEEREGGAAPGFLLRTRFATLAGWVALLFFLLPEMRGGFLIADRIAPLAAMLGVAALPAVSPPRRRLAAVLCAALLVGQWGLMVAGCLRFGAESTGLEELLATTAPGQSLAGLIYEKTSSVWTAPVFLHFPAYYQVAKGGRILFSFAELYQTPVRFRPRKSWDDLLAEWHDLNPQRFDFPRHAGRFRYFLVRGGPERVVAAFGPYLRGLRVRAAGRWFLIEQPPDG